MLVLPVACAQLLNANLVLYFGVYLKPFQAYIILSSNSALVAQAVW